MPLGKHLNPTSQPGKALGILQDCSLQQMVVYVYMSLICILADSLNTTGVGSALLSPFPPFSLRFLYKKYRNL